MTKRLSPRDRAPLYLPPSAAQAFLWQVEHVNEGLNEAAEAAEQGGVNPNEVRAEGCDWAGCAC